MNPSDVPAVSIPSYDVSPIIHSIGEWIVNAWPHMVSFAKSALGIAVGLSFPVSVFFLIAIIYCVERLKIIKKKDALKYDLKVEPAFEEVPARGNADLAARWQKVSAHLNSENPNDWKQAILEADIMLDEVLNSLGYQGESIGEKLKRVQPGEFKAVQEAWDAHKVRNQIAHEGSAFNLTHHEANQAIQKYRRVFEEFYYI